MHMNRIQEVNRCIVAAVDVRVFLFPVVSSGEMMSIIHRCMGRHKAEIARCLSARRGGSKHSLVSRVVLGVIRPA